MYAEVSASSLVRLDMEGNVIDSGTTAFSVDAIAVSLHAAVYAASNSTMCVLHIASSPVLSVSVAQCTRSTS